MGLLHFASDVGQCMQVMSSVSEKGLYGSVAIGSQTRSWVGLAGGVDMARKVRRDSEKVV